MIKLMHLSELLSRHLRCRTLLVCLLLPCLLPRTASGTEPEVTAAQAKILTEAEKLADANLQAALELLNRIPTNQSGAAIEFARGVYYHQLDDIEQAMSAFQQAITTMPDFSRARWNLTQLLLQQGKYDAATEHLRKLLTAPAGREYEIWKLLGYCFLSRDYPVEAETAYRNALIHSPIDLDARLGLIRAVLEQNRLRDVETMIANALELAPDNADLWNLLAHCALQQENQTKALTTLESAYRMNLLNLDSRQTLASLYLARNLPEQAMKIYREIIADTPVPPVPTLLQAATAMMQMQDDEATEEIVQAIDQQAKSLTPEQMNQRQHLRAEIASRRGQPEQARQIYQEILRRQPLDGQALIKFANLLLNDNDSDSATAYFQRASRLPQFAADACVGLARSAVAKQDFQAAADWLKKALKIKPDNTAIKNYLQQVQAAIPKAAQGQ